MVPGLAGQSTYFELNILLNNNPADMFSALMGLHAYKKAWWPVPTGLEAAVSQLTAPRAGCVYSYWTILFCPVPEPSEMDVVDEEPPGLL